MQITASLDRQQVALNEQARLSVTISGNSSNLPAPQLPGLPDFQIYNAGTSQSFSWVNGQTSANVTYNYMLSPKQVGRFTIPPIQVQAGGQSAATQPMSLEVVKAQASAAPAPARASPGGSGAPGIFVTTTVDKSTAYVGEPVTLSFRVYNRVPLLSNPQYQPPDTSGFWTEDLPPQKNYTASARGTQFNVTELRTALFPTTPGRAKIGPAGLRVQIQNLASDPFSGDLFANFFGGGQEKMLNTNPITIQVKPLPEPKPAGFSGAVGQYALSAGLDKRSTTVGQPVELSVSIAGKGNIKSLPDVVWPAFNNFRTFASNAAVNIDKKDYLVQGSKVFKIVLIPTTSGDLTVPPVSYSYFDPEAGSYRTLHSQPLSVSVKPGPAGPQTPGPGFSAPEAPGIRVLGQDIRYIKTSSGLRPKRIPLYRSAWLYILNALAFLFMLGAGLLQLYRRLFFSNPRLVRFRAARGRALKRLQAAEAFASRSQVKEAAREMGDALRGYLAAKLGLNDTGLALKDSVQLMSERKLHDTDKQKVEELWNTLDLFQFAPAQVSPEDIAKAQKDIRTLIDTLEKEIKWEE